MMTVKDLEKVQAQVGILIDPDEETVTVSRQEGEPIVLGNEDALTVTELFPGWELPISELWQPIFTLSRNSSIISHFNTVS
jgi:Uma2 family endonuclease